MMVLGHGERGRSKQGFDATGGMRKQDESKDQLGLHKWEA